MREHNFLLYNANSILVKDLINPHGINKYKQILLKNLELYKICIKLKKKQQFKLL